MRSWSMGLLTMLVACGGAATPCDEAACAPLCEERAADLAARVPEGGVLLTAYERDALREPLDSMRKGPQPVEGFEGQIARICEGVTGCDRALPFGMVRDVPSLLPPAKYLVELDVLVPTVGRWTVDYALTCTDERGATVREVKRTVPLTAPRTQRVLEALPLAEAHQCRMRIDLDRPRDHLAFDATVQLDRS